MYHQSNWATVKATNARAAALYHEIANVGKTIESSKKRVIWRLKVEEGREFEISLTHSLASGKKVLRIDGIVKYTAQAMSFGDWDYVFNLPGGHVVHCIIKPSVELNDMYDLIIDGVSFRRLPDRIEPRAAKAGGGSSRETRGSSNASNLSRPTFRYSHHEMSYEDFAEPVASQQNGPSSRESSFSPWECTRCTLVNDKPLAPVCEACGTAKPLHPKPAKKTTEKKAPVVKDLLDTSSSPTKSDTNGFGTFNPFGSDFAATGNTSSATTGFANFNDFATAAAPVQAPNTATRGRQQSQEEIANMLSGLDFHRAVDTPRPSIAQPEQASGHQETASGSNSRTNSGDLWQSNIVDLNLKPQDKKPKSTSVKSMQTLEQARMTAPQKEKQPVLPPPVPTATMFNPSMTTLPSANGMFNPNMNQHIVMGGPQVGGFGMPPNGAFGSPFATIQAPPTYAMGPPQQFMTNMTTSMPPSFAGAMPQQPKRPAFNADPFSTLY